MADTVNPEVEQYYQTTALSPLYFGDFPKLTSLEGKSQGQRA